MGGARAAVGSCWTREGLDAGRGRAGMCAFRIDPLIRIAPASGGLPCRLQYRSILHVVYLRRVYMSRVSASLHDTDSVSSEGQASARGGEGRSLCEPRTRAVASALSTLGVGQGVLWALPRPRRLRCAKLILWRVG